MGLSRIPIFAVLVTILALTAFSARADEADDLLKEAQKQADRGESQEALTTAKKVIALNPVKGYFFRAALFDLLRKHAEALADYDALIKKDPKIAEAYNQRGSIHFKMGHIT